MKISCGVLLIHDNHILLCHVTGKPQWDIPKGEICIGESPLSCMTRELEEETGYLIDSDEYPLIHDLGEYEYLKNKKLHLFLYEPLNPPNEVQMECSSFFKIYDKEYPEVDKFLYIPFEELEQYASIKLFPVLKKALNLE